MGWGNAHPYLLSDAQTTLTDPRIADPEEQSTAEERLVSLATEPGDEFTYLYDLADGWSHTITVEDIHQAETDNRPRVLDGAGACPPEDIGGIVGYQELLTALTDPANPGHDDALDLLGPDYDPAAYQPSADKIPRASARP
jgi:hypothetical protein